MKLIIVSIKKKSQSSIDELMKERAKRMGFEYDSKCSQVLYDTAEPVGKPLGSITTSAHKVEPIKKTVSPTSNKSVGKNVFKSSV